MAGYIGTTPVPQATQHRESFTATGGQTSFATAGYTPQFIDVYLNGVKLAPADFTATNGSDVVLASGATASDILEIVAYTPFEVANQTFTGTTTAANLAVTGTFTSRGIDDNADAVAITIDSSENVGIGTTSPDLKLDVSHNVSSEYVATFQNTADNLELKIGTTSGLLNIQGANASNNTPYEIALNAEGGNVGIGTSSPSTRLTVGAGVSSEEIRVDAGAGWADLTLNSNATNGGHIYFNDGSNAGEIFYYHVSDYMAFNTAGSEAMRIDSSGNLLVGKTSNSFGTTGVALNPDGSNNMTRSGDPALALNRLSSDGAILSLYKDGTTVGSIGVNGGDLYIENSATGISFNNAHNSIIPTTTGGAVDDANQDLGISSHRWRNLYLSGGVYLGGTGSANKLDDYEEGTYEATLSPSTSGSITLNSSYNLLSYTKVGRLVTVTGRVRVSSVSSPVGFSADLSLPFATHSDSEESSRTTGCVIVAYAAQPINAYGIHPTTSNVSYVNITRIDASTFPTNSAQDFSGDEHIAIMVTYMTA